MVVRSNGKQYTFNDNVRGGDGTVCFGGFIPNDSMPRHARVISEIKLENGCSIGSHQHADEYELFYILEGTATYDDNGAEVKLYPGDFSICRDGESHGIANRDGATVRLLAIVITL